jgi:hypothetical protein
MTNKLSAAQKEALLFLPANGDYVPAGKYGTSLSALRKKYNELIESKTDPTTWGRSVWRLTEKGQQWQKTNNQSSKTA